MSISIRPAILPLTIIYSNIESLVLWARILYYIIRIRLEAEKILPTKTPRHEKN